MASTKADEKMLNITNREMQSKTIMRYHLTSLRMTLSQRQEITSAGMDVEKREDLCTAGGNENWCSH